ncbi:MAG: NUDIX domain-containing protein [Rickettsiales bacterium]|jgi:8-oxo-dGTP pyrophosphatase MutT (NUDIX family)|nr:NUDIX domain-containing protein [Rickettsiales bacterium]
MTEGKIRPIVVAAIKRPDNRYLVNIGEAEGRKWFRMLGGGIKFGETAEEALIREFKEELGADIIVGKKIEAYESIFIYKGKKGHEIVFVYEAEFADKSLYDMDRIPMIEEAFKDEYALWIPLRKISHYGEM